MTVQSQCPKCGKRYRFGDDRRGSRVPCRNCGAAIRIPGRRVPHDPWEDDEDTDEPDPTPRPRKKSRSRKRKGKKSGNKAAVTIVLALACVVVVGGIIGAVVWLRPGGAEEEEGRTDGLMGDPNRKFPSFPYAVTKLPPRLAEHTKNAPFDLNEYFHAPDESDNAANLYLDAMFEFEPDVKNCIAPAMVKQRLAVIEDRLKRLHTVWPADRDRPASVGTARFDALLKEFEPGLKKLEAVQKRSRCVFATGIDLVPEVCHAFAARTIVRVLHLRLKRRLDRGNHDGAMNDLAMCLRLTRDLRNRAPQTALLMSVSIDGAVCSTMVPRILTKSNLTIAHCDRMLRLLREQRRSMEKVTAGFLKAEYLKLHTVLYDLEHRSGSFSKERILEALAGERVEPTPGAILSVVDTLEYTEKQTEYDEVIGRLKPAQYAALRSAIDQQITKYFRVLKQPDYSDVWSDLGSNTLSNSFGSLGTVVKQPADFFKAATVAKAKVESALALTAIKRWMLGPRRQLDLAVACREAGLSQVPRDPFIRDGSIRLTRGYSGQISVYSVGPDIRDEKGQVRWSPNRHNGDLILSLSPPGW